MCVCALVFSQGQKRNWRTKASFKLVFLTLILFHLVLQFHHQQHRAAWVCAKNSRCKAAASKEWKAATLTCLHMDCEARFILGRFWNETMRWAKYDSLRGEGRIYKKRRTRKNGEKLQKDRINNVWEMHAYTWWSCFHNVRAVLRKTSPLRYMPYSPCLAKFTILTLAPFAFPFIHLLACTAFLFTRIDLHLFLQCCLWCKQHIHTGNETNHVHLHYHCPSRDASIKNSFRLSLFLLFSFSLIMPSLRPLALVLALAHPWPDHCFWFIALCVEQHTLLISSSLALQLNCFT